MMATPKLAVRFDAPQGPVAPLFALEEAVVADNSLTAVPYPAYIDIDPIDESVEASHTCEKNGVPEHVHRRVFLRVPAPADVRGAALEEYIKGERFSELFARLASAYERRWNHNIGPDDFGNREEGRFVDDDDDAEQALKEIQDDLECLPRAKIMVAEECAPETDQRDGVVELDDRWEVRGNSTDAELREMAEEIVGDTMSKCGTVHIADSVFSHLDCIRERINMSD